MALAEGGKGRGRARVGGSGFTVFLWRGEAIGFAQQIAHTSPTPVGPGPTPIHPLDEPYPVDIITPAAQNIGTLTLRLYELYNAKVWDRLSLITKSVDLVNIFIKVARSENPITVAKLVRPPTQLAGQTQAPYVERFHNCVITSVTDDETIEVGTMEVLKDITVAYTYMTRDNADSNLAFQLANRPQALGARQA